MRCYYHRNSRTGIDASNRGDNDNTTTTTCDVRRATERPRRERGVFIQNGSRRVAGTRESQTRDTLATNFRAAALLFADRCYRFPSHRRHPRARGATPTCAHVEQT